MRFFLFRPLAALTLGLLAGAAGLLPAASAQDLDDTLIRQAKEAFQKRDKDRLSALKTAALDIRYPLAPWIDYWDLSSRLGEVSAPEVEAFYARWPGSYVEDRLRNDWLLELGKRRDWAGVAREYPHFRMDDDREVTCYALVAAQQSGQAVTEAARQAWMDQKQPDDGCQLLAQTLFDAHQFSETDVWRKLRQAVEFNRQKQARTVAGLLGEGVSKPLTALFDNPARYLARQARSGSRREDELTALALARLAAGDPAVAAKQLEERWSQRLDAENAAWAWAITARQAAFALMPEALDWTEKAWARLKKRDAKDPDWTDDTLAWQARAWLRLGSGEARWRGVLRCIDAMGVDERNSAVWQYWRGRALLALAKPGEAGQTERREGQALLQALAPQLGYYGQLASEDLGSVQALPPRPTVLSPTERDAMRRHPGLQRALTLFGIGMRSEAVREWNFSLIGLSDRELLSAAQLACEREIWDRCINSSEKTRAEFDLAQRFPTPHADELLPRAREIGLDPAYAYGLVRQESRFITDARSGVGASGLMQVMPSTAKWTAKKIGMSDYKPGLLSDKAVNLKLGTAYLKLVLDDMDGSQPLAAAAYNAGPNRPRRWRDGPVLEPAMWVENIPFNETRDYVKKVLSNATYYAGLMGGKPASLKARMGPSIGPRTTPAPTLDADLP